MRRWAAATSLACASIVLGIRAGAAGAPPRRPALDEARPPSASRRGWGTALRWDESGVIALEYFPILHRDGSAWTLALVVEMHFGRHLKRYGSH